MALLTLLLIRNDKTFQILEDCTKNKAYFLRIDKEYISVYDKNSIVQSHN